MSFSARSACPSGRLPSPCVADVHSLVCDSRVAYCRSAGAEVERERGCLPGECAATAQVSAFKGERRLVGAGAVVHRDGRAGACARRRRGDERRDERGASDKGCHFERESAKQQRRFLRRRGTLWAHQRKRERMEAVAGFVQVSVAYMPQDEWWKGKHGNTRQHTRPRTACPLYLPYLSSFHTLTFLDLVTTQPSLSDPDLPTSGSVTSLKPSYSKGCLSCACAPAAVSAGRCGARSSGAWEW